MEYTNYFLSVVALLVWVLYIREDVIRAYKESKIIRLPIDRFTYFVNSTKASDKQKINDALKHYNCDNIEAICKIIAAETVEGFIESLGGELIDSRKTNPCVIQPDGTATHIDKYTHTAQLEGRFICQQK